MGVALVRNVNYTLHTKRTWQIIWWPVPAVSNDGAAKRILWMGANKGEVTNDEAGKSSLWVPMASKFKVY
jgi:hypothetical protein